MCSATRWSKWSTSSLVERVGGGGGGQVGPYFDLSVRVSFIRYLVSVPRERDTADVWHEEKSFMRVDELLDR